MATPKTTLTVTHITTATAILNIDGINFLTDPYFGTEGSHVTELDWQHARLQEDFGHEDHLDNLDPEGRKLLDGRKVFTTMDGASKLRPRPGVVGLRPWQTVTAKVGEKTFRITGTPCKHFPIGEVTGFILETDSFGIDTASGKTNAIYFSGDTVYIDELKEIGDKWHVMAAVLNLGNATFHFPIGPIQITMDGKQAAQMIRDIGADVMVPMHFESWEHFTEYRDDSVKVFEEEGIMDRVCWTTPGVPKIVY